MKVFIVFCLLPALSWAISCSNETLSWNSGRPSTLVTCPEGVTTCYRITREVPSGCMKSKETVYACDVENLCSRKRIEEGCGNFLEAVWGSHGFFGQVGYYPSNSRLCCMKNGNFDHLPIE